MFPKGDISGKYSSLMGPSQQFNFPELPMYGPFTLMGRTMREISIDVSHFARIIYSIDRVTYIGLYQQCHPQCIMHRELSRVYLLSLSLYSSLS